MLEQEDFEAITISRAMGVAAEKIQDAINSFRHAGQNSEDEYLRDRLAEFIEEPDKAAGFVFVGNDTWQPKHLVNARKRQQCKLSRRAESGIVWTR